MGYIFPFERKNFTPDGLIDSMIDIEAHNQEVSKKEIEFILKEKPYKIFCYPDRKTNAVTTWIGEPLGLIVYQGSPYKSNFGDTREAVNVIIDGTRYHGTLYDGMYIRLTKNKNPK